MRRSLIRRTAKWASAAFGIAFIISLVLSFMFNEHKVFDECYTRTRRAAFTVNSSLENEDIVQIAYDPSSDDYERVRNDLHGICADFELDFLYLYQVNDSKSQRTYLMCVADDGQDNEAVESLTVDYVISDDSISQQEIDALQGSPSTQPTTFDNALGREYAWFYPLYNGGKIVGVIGCDLDVMAVSQSVNSSSVLLVILMAVQTAIVIGVMLYKMRQCILLPLDTISHHISSFVNTSNTYEYVNELEPLKLTSGDEIQQIADAFDTMVVDLNEHIEHTQRLMEERVVMATELDVARRIQAGIAPDRVRLEGAGYVGFACAHSAREVGGDFYDLFELKDGRVAAFIGDVSGKGISAALFMSTVRTRIHERLMLGMGPGQVLTHINVELCAQNPMMLFVTAFACVFDSVSGLLMYANAGHTPPVLFDDDACFLKPQADDVLGLFEDATYTEETLTLAPGTGILLYTDGITEATNTARDFFGDNNLLAAVRAAHDGDAESIVGCVQDAVESFSMQCEQHDDLTMLAFARTTNCFDGFGLAPFRHAVTFVLEPALASLAQVKEALCAELSRGQKLKRVFLAVDEVFSNIVSYSHATAVSVCCGYSNDAFVVVLSDDGVPFDPLTHPRGDKEFEDFEFGGMGIGLVLSATDDVRYERRYNANVLALSFFE